MNPAAGLPLEAAQGAGRLVSRPVAELRPHPSYQRHGIAVTTTQLSALASIPSDALFREPLEIARGGSILDGYARWQIACERGVETLACLEYDLTEEQALIRLIQTHHRVRGLNDFCLIVLALELEPMLRERARVNQQRGGHEKVSSNLSKAERLDVRKEIARAASASAGNVTKVRDLLERAQPEVLKALRQGEVSIHRAWQWLKKPAQQTELLQIYRNRCGITRKIGELLRAHQNGTAKEQVNVENLAAALAAFDTAQRDAVVVAELDLPGHTLIVSRSLRQALTRQGEMFS